ncbi:MAG: hypothetical protein H7144_17055 [Burkholderiales bacterium]|nr:hypothetical protein [Phycisphaerae bacterium]
MVKALQKHLSTDLAGRPIPRLAADAARLTRRVRALARLSLTNGTPNDAALELACYALQLPMRQATLAAGGKYGQFNLRQRSEQAAELLVSRFSGDIDEKLLDETTDLLTNLPAKSPRSDDARLLADAVNLDDFGIVGLFNSCVTMAVQGHGTEALIDGAKKRDAYGYWESRLRDSFHFPQVRAIAVKRLAAARKLVAQVEAELAEEI